MVPCCRVPAARNSETCQTRAAFGLGSRRSVLQSRRTSIAVALGMGVSQAKTGAARLWAISLLGYAWSLGYKDPLDPLPPPQLWHHIAQGSLASSTGGVPLGHILGWYLG